MRAGSNPYLFYEVGKSTAELNAAHPCVDESQDILADVLRRQGDYAGTKEHYLGAAGEDHSEAATLRSMRLGLLRPCQNHI